MKWHVVVAASLYGVLALRAQPPQSHTQTAEPTEATALKKASAATSKKPNPFQPLCFNEKVQAVKVDSLLIHDQGPNGNCYAHAPVATLENAHFRREGSAARLSIDYGLCLNRAKSDAATITDNIETTIGYGKAAAGGNPTALMNELLASEVAPRSGGAADLEVRKFLQSFQDEMDDYVAEVNSLTAKSTATEGAKILKHVMDDTKRAKLELDLYEGLRKRAQEQQDLLSRYGSFVDANGLPRDTLRDSKIRLEIQSAWKNRADNQSFLKKHLELYPKAEDYEAARSKADRQVEETTEAWKVFTQGNQARAIWGLSPKLCHDGKCFDELLARLKKKWPQDFVDLKDFERVSLKDNLFGEQACDAELLFRTFPAEKICDVYDFDVVVDRRTHAGENISERDYLKQLLKARGAVDPAALMGAVRKSYVSLELEAKARGRVSR